MDVLAFHAAEFMTLALKARDRAADARRADPTVMAEDALVSLVMAAVTTEAFINELGAYYELRKIAGTIDPVEAACGDALAEVERSRGSTELKYLVASLTLSGQMFNRSMQPFQDFSTLMTVRNTLVHPKPLDRSDDSGVMVPPAYVREFERRGMTYAREADLSVSWLNLLETEKVASWACQAAVDVILSLADMAPVVGAIASLRRSFFEHYRPWAHRVP